MNNNAKFYVAVATGCGMSLVVMLMTKQYFYIGAFASFALGLFVSEIIDKS